MYKICHTEDSSRRQRELEMGLLEAMGKQPYARISLTELCRELNIPRKSFYRYFPTKEDCLLALIDHTLALFFEMPTAKNKTRGTALGDLDLYFLFWYENRTLLDALQRSSLSGILVERANNFALKEGHLPRQFKTMPPQTRGLAMAFSICGLMSMILQWHRTGFTITPDEMTKLAQSILTAPLLPR